MGDQEASIGPTRAERIAEAKAIEAAISEAVLEALLQHKRAGNPVFGWHEGKLQWVMPEDIPVEDTPSGPRWRKS